MPSCGRLQLAVFVVTLMAAVAQQASAENARGTESHVGDTMLAALAGELFEGRDYAVTQGTTTVFFFDILDWTVYRDEAAPRMVVLRVLTDNLPGDMPAGLAAVLGDHLAAAKMRAVESAYAELREGDLVVVRRSKDGGAMVSVNGHLVADTASAELVPDVVLCVKQPTRVMSPNDGGMRVAAGATR